MSKALRLPSIINKFILEKWLSEYSAPTSEEECLRSSNLDSNSVSAAFYAYFDGSSISDSHYFMPASSAIALPTNSHILITEWDLFYCKGLHLVILKAELQPEVLENAETLKISLDQNPLIFASIKKFIFQRLQKRVKESAGKNENSFIFPPDLLKTIENPSKDLKKGVKEESEEDIFDMIDLSTNENQAKPNISESDWNIGIEQFPEYALEYLKHKYNLI